jgi:hypothetical protein
MTREENNIIMRIRMTIIMSWKNMAAIMDPVRYINRQRI